ncbi:MAG: hypothetical protein IJR45_05470, partial [Firmicutes bacterium]|nr:hypothetical protein [Bacillota bacterium]
LKDTLTSSEGYRELTKMLANYSKFTALGMNGIEIAGFIIFLLAAYVAAAAAGNFICGISGLRAVKGIKIRRARIIGTAALVIGICNIIEKIFVWKNGIGAYGILYIAAAALFLYCVNSIKPEKGDKK